MDVAIIMMEFFSQKIRLPGSIHPPANFVIVEGVNSQTSCH